MNFELEQILELIKSKNPHFCKIAKKYIVDNFHIHNDLFFNYFMQNSYDDDLRQYAEQRFPMLLGGFDKPFPFDMKKEYHYFTKYANEYQLFLDKLSDYLNNTQETENKQRLLINLYKSFEGIRVDLENIYPNYDYSINVKDNGKEQLMVFITGKCNLQCSYCFSQELSRVEMSLSDFEEILQWASSNQVVRISLCGGEPTLHSRFDEILCLIADYGLKTYFATNFTIDCTLLQHFNRKCIDKISIHLTDKIIEEQYLKKCLYKNIQYAKAQGIELVYRTNIVDKLPKVEEWLQIIKETDLPALQIALTFPTQHLTNQFVDITLFDEYAEVIQKIINETHKSNVDLSFAKPVPLCIFDEQMQRYLLSYENFYPICGIHFQNYTNNVCISPEMNFHPCLGITNKSLKFRKEISWQEVENSCVNTIHPLINKPLFDKCSYCFLFDRKLCQGACLAYKNHIK